MGEDMNSKSRSASLSEGDRAPRFELQGVHNGEIKAYSLDNLLESGSVLLGVYVFDFSPVCTAQMCQISDMDWYQYKNNLTVLGVSTDGPYSHMEFAEQEGLDYPLLCDTDGQLLRDYGVLMEEEDGIREVPRRSIFLIDRDGFIQYRWVAADNWDDVDGTLNPVEEAINQL